MSPSRWATKVEIKQFIDPDQPFDQVRDKIVAVLDRFAKRPGYNDDDELVDIIENLRIAEDIEELDEWLEQLYDWADGMRVWIGGHLGEYWQQKNTTATPA